MPTSDGPPRPLEIGPHALALLVEHGERIEAFLWRKVMALEAENTELRMRLVLAGSADQQATITELRTTLHAHGVEGY